MTPLQTEILNWIVVGAGVCGLVIVATVAWWVLTAVLSEGRGR